ncbi:MAG: hypothetical protein ACK55Z_06000 [bacterium]
MCSTRGACEQPSPGAQRPARASGRRAAASGNAGGGGAPAALS